MNLSVPNNPNWRDLHSAACRLYEAGFSIIRLSPGQKTPADMWSTYQTRRASMSEINTWWSPRTSGSPYGIGVVAGVVSNSAVLDFDPFEGHTIEDLVAEAETKLKNKFPATCRVLTSGGGYHDYYRISGPTRTLALFQGVHGKIQLRGEGTQTVAPPTIAHSNRINGLGQYTFKTPLSARINLEDTWLKQYIDTLAQENTAIPIEGTVTEPTQEEIENVLNLYKRRLSDVAKEILTGEHKSEDRSAQCYQLACELVRAGVSSPQNIATIVLAAPCHQEKFGSRPKNSDWGAWNHAQRLAAKALAEHSISPIVPVAPPLPPPPQPTLVKPAQQTAQNNKIILEDVVEFPFTCVPLAKVEPEECTFLLDPYLPRGEITLLDGDPGIGKSWVWMALVAGITNSKVCKLPQLPYGDYTIKNLKRKPKIMILTSEDSLGKTVRPRLEDLGAGLDCIDVFMPTGTTGNVTAEHISVVASVIQEQAPDLIIIDPITLFESSRKNYDNAKAVDVRKLLSQLITIVREQRCALIIVRHFRKATGSALHRGAGSIDYAASARSILTIGKNTSTGELLLAHTKSNLAPKGHALAYALRPGAYPVFEWLGARNINPDILTDGNMAKQEEDYSNKKSKIEEAVQFAQEVLSEGRCESKDLFKQAREGGIAEETLRKALGAINAKSSREGSGRNRTLKHFWELP